MDPFKKQWLESLELHKREALLVDAQCKQQLAEYLSRARNISHERALEVIEDMRKEREEAEMVLYIREDMSDKKEIRLPISEFFKLVDEEDLVLVPTLSTYLPAYKLRSWLGRFTIENMKKRTVLRAETYAARVDGNVALARRKQASQILTKLDNNILSGIAKSRSSILFCTSNHSTLTSTTRCITSTCNANSERLLRGKVMFMRVNIIVGYIMSIVTDLKDRNLTQDWSDVLTKYKLKVPTEDDIVQFIRSNSDVYFKWTKRADDVVMPVVRTLTEVERAAVFYSGSFHNVSLLNHDFIDELLSVTRTKAVVKEPLENPLEEIPTLSRELLLVSHYRYYNELRGRGIEYEKFDKDLLSSLVVNTRRYERTITDNEDFFKTVIRTYVHPPNVYDYKDCIRDSVIMSDTDSGVHFLERMCEKFNGNANINGDNLAMAGFLVMLNSLVLQWFLRSIMVNMNVDKEEIERQRLNLKPEFAMVVFCLMSVSKHYSAGLYVENGNVYEELELETKGGTLRNSAIPASIRDTNSKISKGIMQDIIDTGKVSLKKYVAYAALMELEIFMSIYSGEANYLRTMGIDGPDSYKNKDPAKNNYKHCLFWNLTFSKTLNFEAKVPYRALMLPVKLTNKTMVKEFIDDLDGDMKAGFTEWVTKYTGGDIKTLYVPMEYSIAYGIPKVLLPIIDSKRLVLTLTTMLHISLETLAFYCKPSCTILETLGFSLDYETLANLKSEYDRTGIIGGTDVAWAEKVDINTGIESYPIPESF